MLFAMPKGTLIVDSPDTSGSLAFLKMSIYTIQFTVPLADKGYDSDAILDQAKSHGMEPVIPPKRNRKVQRPYDKDLYKLRHLVENTFLKLKGWRGIVTRYAKNSTSFLATVQIRYLFLWASIS